MGKEPAERAEQATEAARESKVKTSGSRGDVVLVIYDRQGKRKSLRSHQIDAFLRKHELKITVGIGNSRARTCC